MTPSAAPVRGAGSDAPWAPLLVVVGLLATIALLPAREGVPAPYASALERMLTHGPGGGRWRIEDAFGSKIRALAPVPDAPGRMYVGRVEGGAAGGGGEAWGREVPPADPLTAEARRVRVFPLARLAFYAGGAPAAVFFRNYVPAGPPLADRARDGSEALRVAWVPRHDLGGDTRRLVWHDPTSYEVVQVEDRSYHGRVVHGLYRISREPGPMATPPPDRGPRPPGPGAWTPKPPGAAPFPVLAPTYLPPGYEPAFSHYQEWPAPPRRQGEPGAGDPAGGERRMTRAASLAYTDGLGFIAVTVAPREDLDAIEAFTARLAQTHRDPEACGSLPEPSGDVADGGLLIRRRADLCRTVLRVDDVGGVSVLVLGRNEVPGDEYLKVVRSLAPLPPVPPAD